MRVAVTGARGFVGQHAVEVLEAAGHDVIRLGRDGHGRLHRIDEPDEARLLAGVDTVVHLAGVLSLGPESHIADYLDANVTLTEQLAVDAVDAGATNFVFASTRLVYPASLRRPAVESDADPDNAYGMSKWFAEQVVAYHGRRCGLSTVSLRLSQLVGRGHSGLGVLPAFARAAAAGGPIRVQGSGSAVRDFLDVADAAQAVRLAAEQRGEPGRVYNIGGGGRSLADLAQIAARTFGLPGSAVEHVTVDDDDTSHWSLDTTLAFEQLGWRPTSSVEDLVRAAVAQDVA